MQTALKLTSSVSLTTEWLGRMDRSRTSSAKIDISSVSDKATKDALSKVLEGGAKATTLQSDNGSDVPVRYNKTSNALEVYNSATKKWSSTLTSSSQNTVSPKATSSWPNSFIVPETKTKITYDAYGLVTSGEDVAVADVTGLVDDLAGKSDVGHGHAQSDITGLVSDLSGKAPTSHSHAISDVTALQTALDAKALTSTDGQRLKVYDTGTSSWVYITCVNGVLSVLTA